MVKITRDKDWYIVSTEYDNENIQSLANRLSGGKKVKLFEKFIYWNQDLDNYTELFVKDNLVLTKNGAYWIFVDKVFHNQKGEICKNLRKDTNTTNFNLKAESWNLVSTDREETMQSLLKRIIGSNKFTVSPKYFSLSEKSSKYNEFNMNNDNLLKINEGYWIYLESLDTDFVGSDNFNKNVDSTNRFLSVKLSNTKKRLQELERKVEELSNTSNIKVNKVEANKEKVEEDDIEESDSDEELDDVLDKEIYEENENDETDDFRNMKMEANKEGKLAEAPDVFENFTSSNKFLKIVKTQNVYEFYLTGFSRANHNFPVLRHILKTIRLQNVKNGRTLDNSDTYLTCGENGPTELEDIFYTKNNINFKHLHDITWKADKDFTMANRVEDFDYKFMQITAKEGFSLQGRLFYRYADPSFKDYFSYRVVFKKNGTFKIMTNKTEYPANFRLLYVSPSENPSVSPYYYFSNYRTEDYRYNTLNSFKKELQVQKGLVYIIERDDPVDSGDYPIDIKYETSINKNDDERSVILSGFPLVSNQDQKVLYVKGYNSSNPFEEFDSTYDKIMYYSNDNDLMKGNISVVGATKPRFAAENLTKPQESVKDHLRVIRNGEIYTFYLTNFDISNHNHNVERHFLSTECLKNIDVGENMFEDENTFLSSNGKVCHDKIYNFNKSKSWDALDNVSWYTARDYSLKDNSKNYNYEIFQIKSTRGSFLEGELEYIYADPTYSFYKKYKITFNNLGESIISSRSSPDWIPNFRKIYVTPTIRPYPGATPYYDFFPSKPTLGNKVNNRTVFRLNGGAIIEDTDDANGHLTEAGYQRGKQQGLGDNKLTASRGENMLLIKGVHYIFEWYHENENGRRTVGKYVVDSSGVKRRVTGAKMVGPMNFKYTQKLGTEAPIIINGEPIECTSDQMILYIKDFGYDCLNPWNEFNTELDTLHYYNTCDKTMTRQFNVQDREAVGYTFMGSALEKGWVDRWWDDTTTTSIKQKIEGKKLALIVDGTVLEFPDTINYDSTSSDLLKLKNTITSEDKKNLSLEIIEKRLDEVKCSKRKSEKQIKKIQKQHDRMHYLIDQIKTMPEFCGSSLLNKRITKLETFLGRAVKKSRECYNNDLEDIKTIKDNLKIVNKSELEINNQKLVKHKHRNECGPKYDEHKSLCNGTDICDTSCDNKSNNNCSDDNCSTSKNNCKTKSDKSKRKIKKLKKALKEIKKNKKKCDTKTTTTSTATSTTTSTATSSTKDSTCTNKIKITIDGKEMDVFI